jgi:hypothetical protein
MYSGILRPMDFQTLAVLYTTKSDEELLELASQSDQLTLEAQSALRSEIGKRRLEFEGVPARITPLPSTVSIHDTARPSKPPVALPVGEFVAEVFRFYRRNRWRYIALIFPAVAVGTLAIILGKHEAHEIERHLPRGSAILQHPLEIAEIGVATWSGFFVSWIAFCFSYGAICALFEQVYSGFQASIRDALSSIRERLGPFLRISLLLWASLLVLAFLGMILNSILWGIVLHMGQSGATLTYALSYGLFAIVILILARFGLAIPAVILDDYPAGRAMFRSDELTEGKWSILAVLLFKSIVGGYVAGMLPFWLAGWIPASINLPSWFPWTLTGASIAAVTLVEPIMFIGFALLYEKTCGRRVLINIQTAAASSS